MDTSITHRFMFMITQFTKILSPVYNNPYTSYRPLNEHIWACTRLHVHMLDSYIAAAKQQLQCCLSARRAVVCYNGGYASCNGVWPRNTEPTSWSRLLIRLVNLCRQEEVEGSICTDSSVGLLAECARDRLLKSVKISPGWCFYHRMSEIAHLAVCYLLWEDWSQDAQDSQALATSFQAQAQRWWAESPPASISKILLRYLWHARMICAYHDCSMSLRMWSQCSLQVVRIHKTINRGRCAGAEHIYLIYLTNAFISRTDSERPLTFWRRW